MKVFSHIDFKRNISFKLIFQIINLLKMTSINFSYQNKSTVIQCNENEIVNEVFKRFCNKTGANINLVYFLYDGSSNINTHLTIGELASNEDKNRKAMNILVNDIEETDDNPSIIKSSEVICPKCGEVANLFFEDFKINFECRSGHKIKNILFNEFEKTQLIDTSKIICDSCKFNNKNESFGNKFYRCNYCKTNLCPLCRNKHDKSHFTIDYDLKNYYCQIHEKDYNSYCLKCKKNLCQFCEKEHKDHNLIFFGNMILSQEDVKSKYDEVKRKIEKGIEHIKDIIDKCFKTIEFLNFYNKIVTSIVNNYNMKKINYEVLNNINQAIKIKGTTNYIYQDLDELNEYEENKKAYKIIDIYNRICIKEKNYITLNYKVKENEKTIKLFSEDFVDNNKDVCQIIIDGKIRNLLIEYYLEDIKIKEHILEVKLLGINKIKNASWMFFQCSSLISSPDLGQWNTINVVDMGCMFSHFKSLTLPYDICNWNTSNVTNMNNMFYNCEILTLPDISKWDTSKVKDMSYMFSECSSLIEFPDISKWDTSNVIDIEGIFNNCVSIEYLPDISKWNTQKVKSMTNLFKFCSSLKSLPNISNWDTSQVTDMSYMFYECNTLTSLPDISNWNTSNVKNMSYMFYGCKSLKSLPNINNWNTDNLAEKHKIFDSCDSSLDIPSKFKKKFLGIFPI